MRRIMIGVLICILFSVWALVHGVFAANYGPQQTVIVARDITDALTLDPNLVYERSGFIADPQYLLQPDHFRGRQPDAAARAGGPVVGSKPGRVVAFARGRW